MLLFAMIAELVMGLCVLGSFGRATLDHRSSNMYTKKI